MIITPSSSFTRPANTTAYADGDLIANSTTAASVTPLEFKLNDLDRKSGCVGFVRIFKDYQTVTNATFDLLLFTQSPTVTNGDNGALAVSTAQYYIGTVACDMSSDAVASSTDAAKRFPILSTVSSISYPGLIAFDVEREAGAIGSLSLYGLLKARAAYTPASGEQFTVTLEIGDDGGYR